MANLPPAISHDPEGPQGRSTRQIALSRASPSGWWRCGDANWKTPVDIFNSDMKIRGLYVDVYVLNLVSYISYTY
jgi:hypothetical protein